MNDYLSAFFLYNPSSLKLYVCIKNADLQLHAGWCFGMVQRVRSSYMYFIYVFDRSDLSQGISGSSRETNKSQKNTMIKQNWTRQKQRVATDIWRSLGCRTTPLEHWSKKRKPTVEPRRAKQKTKELRPQPTKINSFMSRPSLSLTPDPPACNQRGKQSY